MRRRALAVAAVVLVNVLAVELGCQLAYRLKSGHWLATRRGGYTRPMFRRHPYLAASGRPGAVFDNKGSLLRHNAAGHRGPLPPAPRDRERVRVVTLGGSTTYCSHLPEDRTWPAQLERELGPGYEVINLAAPAYSTVENLIQTALWLSDLEPDIAVYLEGWNDAHNSHVAGLRGDYSDFHGPRLLVELSLTPWQAPTRLASLHFARYFLAAADERQPSPEGGPLRLTGRPDERALGLYRRNLKLIAALCRAQGIEPLFVPQRLNDAALTSDESSHWVPFVRDKDLPGVIRAYNEAMADAARGSGVSFVRGLMTEGFGLEDYVDKGHLSERGSAKVARHVAEELRQMRAPPAKGRAGRAAR